MCLQTGYSFSAAALGMNMGIFTLGLLNPWCNWIVSIFPKRYLLVYCTYTQVQLPIFRELWLEWF